MVYYGALSRGCQRCRQRKVKCDQRKPACLKCEKLGSECPGYRDLNNFLFRDESGRTIRRARKTRQVQDIAEQAALVCADASFNLGLQVPERSSSLVSPVLALGHVPCSLVQPATELGACFFFTKYAFHEPPFSFDYHDWLSRCYVDGSSRQVLRKAIEAVGMAGISNVSPSSSIASKASRGYCDALGAIHQALNDPVEAVSDTTLMAVILLCLYETVEFEDWGRYNRWMAHVRGATTLLELRGQTQFASDRGAQLYVQIRSQIILACMQQNLTVPPALVRMTYDFQTSNTRQRWQSRQVASPASISEISFRLVNFWAAFKNGEIQDPSAIRATALELDEDMRAWKAAVPSNWLYYSMKSNVADHSLFDGQQHVYRTLWTAEVWNNWRIMRVLANQILLQNDLQVPLLSPGEKSAIISTIQECSADLCTASAVFMGTPRAISLISQLYVVAMEKQNTDKIRLFALGQLRKIAISMGIRQAGLLAETVSKNLRGEPGGFDYATSRYAIPLVSLENEAE